MLERIAEVQGIGLLHQANGKPYACQKGTLIYADNGRGKSTLATVLRSAATGDPSLIADRKTVDGTVQPKVVLQFNSGHKVSFSAGAWSEQRPEILVFDAEFIERNVHSGGAVSTGHRKNLLAFALGEAAVVARSSVDKATFDSKAEASKFQALVDQLSGHHKGMTLQHFQKLPQASDVDAQVQALQIRIKAAGSTASIAAKPIPAMLPVPHIDLEGIFADLAASLEDVHADAERTVREHAGKIGGKAAEGWLSQGHQFDDGTTCPYCGQDISDNDLIRAYQTHFNVAYKALKTKVGSLPGVARTATSPAIVETFAQGVAVAVAHANALVDYVQVPSIVFDATAAKAALADLQTTLLVLCDKKQAAPTESVGNTGDLQCAQSLWGKVLACMQDANDSIKIANTLISSYKSQLAVESVQQLESQVQNLLACKRRHDQVVVSLFAQLGTAKVAANAAEKAKKAARDKLDASMKAILAKYETAINELLKKFGASFSIKGMGANFRGAAPRTEYGLLLRGREVALDGSSPTFATALSEGDKRTLAFAFFIASTMADPKLSSRTVVIDDPMCSLDLNRKQHTKTVLRKLYSSAEQLIVLAHDPYFIRDLRDGFARDSGAAAIALFQLRLASASYTDFAPFDVDEVCESAYFQHHRVLNQFSAGNGGDLRSIAKAIRPMLEGYLHRRFPGLVPKSLMFGQVIVLIRDADSSSPLSHAKNMVSELSEINDYAGKFHHDTNPEADIVSITSGELETFVERALASVHRGT